MSPDLEKKVIADLEKTGFPSEFEVRRVIYSFSGRWDCTGTMGYFDLDEQKHRQVDMYAFMPCGDRVSKTRHTHTVWHLIIEVKKSEGGKPWIVFKERRDVIRDVLRWRKDMVAYCNLPAEWGENFSWRIYENSFCKGQDWIGYGVHESFRQPSEISRPYGAMLSVVKASEHFYNGTKSWMDGEQRVTQDISKKPTRLSFIRPVLILDGELLAAEIDKSGKLLVSEIEMAPMYVGYKSPHHDRELYRVDLVKLNALSKYLSSVERQHNAIRKAIIELGGLGGYSEEELINGAKPKKVSQAVIKKRSKASKRA
jgi:hypothetical protein